MATSKRCKKTGKKKLATLNNAIHAALTNSIKFGKPFRPYECTNHWHLTTKPDRSSPSVAPRKV